MTKYLQIILTVLTLTACGQGQMKTPENAMDKFEEFKKKEKFIEDNTLFYPGIADLKMRPMLTEKINQAANDFKEIALTKMNDLEAELSRYQIEIVCSYFRSKLRGIKPQDPNVLRTRDQFG